ncbi:MAG: heme lyase CcmF/NrfE family subunit, partial [Chloroflexi bacterium]|nr:heme lyase CcmF/NrfE family subunit [Chloroflexota bacterium]
RGQPFTGQKITVGPPFYVRATGPLFGGLLLLMGIAPLSAWGHSTAKTLGRAIWKPLAVSILALAVILAFGVRSVGALIGFWLSAFVACVTFYEYGRGALARHKRTGESLPVALLHLAERNRRRYGGYIIHLGVVLSAIGILGMQIYQTQTQGTIPQGGQINLDGYTLTYKSLAIFDTQDGSTNIARAVVQVSKGGKVLGDLYPRRDYYYTAQQPMTIPGVRSTLEDDVYVILVDWLPITSQGATFKVYHNPLVNWLWLGGLVFILGALVAAWPDREQAPQAVVERRRERNCGR